MNQQQLNIDTILNDKKFREYYSLGLIDDIAVRNLKIKNEYAELRKQHSTFASISILSSKYFLSFDSINSILFRERNKKSLPAFQFSR